MESNPSVSNKTGHSLPLENHVFRIFEISNFPRDNVQRNLLEKREHMIGKLGRISETMSKCSFGTRCFFCISGWAKNSVRHIKITNVSKIGMDIYHVKLNRWIPGKIRNRSEANQETVPNSDGECLQRLVRCAQTFERRRQQHQREAEEFKLPDDFQYVTWEATTHWCE